MVLASDKIASIRKPIISVDFDINQGSAVKPVTVEMSKEELKNLITSLEAANKVHLLHEYSVAYESFALKYTKREQAWSRS